MNAAEFSSQSLVDLKLKLESHGQGHVLQFWDKLSASEQQSLFEQLNKTDFDQLASLFSAVSEGNHWAELAARAEAPPAITLEDFADAKSRDAARTVGLEAISAGKVAMIVVAGGQGSRLGFNHPKGMFPIGPLSNRTLFQIFIDTLRSRSAQCQTTIPFYIMTSPPTHDETIAFLTENNWFGMSPDDIKVFCQGTMPAVDADGKILLESKGKVFESPDGHGGTIKALEVNGCIADMQRRGIEHVFYGQIDNPLVQICDPALIGFHIQKQSELTTQVVRKTEPMQKVGNVVQIDGVVQIIEYSDLPEEPASQTQADGSLKLWAGNIAVHIFKFDFLQRALADADSLPFHRAHKKVPFVDADGNLVQPEAPNAYKFEKFIFDLLPAAKNAIVCEVDPAEGFCAVKNAPPATAETPEHVKVAILDLHRSWLEAAGAVVKTDVSVEIDPMFAVDREMVAEKVKPGTTFETDTFLQ